MSDTSSRGEWERRRARAEDEWFAIQLEQQQLTGQQELLDQRRRELTLTYIELNREARQHRQQGR
jgi:hypothetical protein